MFGFRLDDMFAGEVPQLQAGYNAVQVGLRPQVPPKLSPRRIICLPRSENFEIRTFRGFGTDSFPGFNQGKE